MYDENTLTALASGQLVLADFLTVHGWDSDDDPVDYCFWTGEDNVTVSVVAPDGELDARDYVGGGTLIEVPAIVETLGLDARGIELGLSQLHAAVQDMARGGNIRVARAELHRGLYSPSTWQLVAAPQLRFLGRVDGLSIDTPAVGGEGSIRLTLVPDTIDLTRTSPALKSDETQRLRSNDRFRRYSDAAGSFEVWWGQAKST